MGVFFKLLMGHMVGDYLLQGKTMATDKGQSNTLKGWGWCILHCVLYTLSICAFLLLNLTVIFSFPFLSIEVIGSVEWWFFIGIFLSHFIVDKFSLASIWLKMIRGRTFEDAMNEPNEEKRPFSIAFACIVYVAVDNTMHFLLMWPVLAWAGII